MSKKSNLEQLKIAFKQHLIFEKLVCIFLEKVGLANLSIQRLQVQQKIFNRLKKKYQGEIILKQPLEPLEENRTIWICWLQGIQNAPLLVRKCRDSVMRNRGDWNVIFVDEQNMREYVHLPEFILTKWKKGIISNQHFSDILRLQLLSEHGGLWLDATVYMTETVPNYIVRHDFFVYSHEHQNDENVSIDNWLIYSRRGNPILMAFRDIVLLYWKEHDFACHYFFGQMLFQIIIDKYPEQWEKIPYVCDLIPHTLHHEIFRCFDEQRMKEIENLTPIHKLSNRYEENDKKIKNSFYDVLINH